MKKPIMQRFDERWIAAPLTGCWEWTAGRTGRGYATISIAKKTVYAHRLSWTLHRGPIPYGIDVLHRCDNTGCVNPDHLLLGTHLDNMRDKVAKNRQSRMAREESPQAKLSEEQIANIRDEYAKGAKQADLAKEHGTCQTNISSIVRGATWRP